MSEGSSKEATAASKLTSAWMDCAANRASRSWSVSSWRENRNEPAKLFCRVEAAQRCPRGRPLPGRCLVTDSGSQHSPSNVRRAGLVATQHCDPARDRLSSRAGLQLGVRTDAPGLKAR